VGGVPEVLPDNMLLLAEPSPDGLVAAVGQALERVRQHPADPWQQHAAVRDMYSWQSIARRTEHVYWQVLRGGGRDDSMVGRLRRYHKCGKWFGKICCCITGEQEPHCGRHACMRSVAGIG
jgi:phosphatidylinositol glycan class A protein